MKTPVRNESRLPGLLYTGDVVRFADGDIHGITNSSTEEFVYISVTSPPINFRYAYKGEK
jgi:quercetin dioxygenase-like cupin family protein